MPIELFKARGFLARGVGTGGLDAQGLHHHVYGRTVRAKGATHKNVTPLSIYVRKRKAVLDGLRQGLYAGVQ